MRAVADSLTASAASLAPDAAPLAPASSPAGAEAVEAATAVLEDERRCFVRDVGQSLLRVHWSGNGAESAEGDACSREITRGTSRNAHARKQS
eukprot:s893_g4.t1